MPASEGDRDATSVLLVTSGIDGVGGIQRYCRSLRTALQATVALASVDLGPGPSRPARAAAAARAVVTAWRRRPDLVVLAHVGLGPIGWACRLAGIRYVVMAYGIEVWGPVRRGQRLTFRLAASVWPLSHFTAGEVVRLHPVARLGPPVGGCVDERFLTVDAVAKGPADPFVVLTVARAGDAAYKGLDTCAAALATLAPDHHVEYRVVGAGQTASTVSALLGGSALPPFVSVVGPVDEPGLLDEYRRASVCVLLSRYRSGPEPAGEGLGLVLLEAAAVGVPGIASSAGGGPETVVDGVTGFVVDPEDAAGLAARLTDLLDEQRRLAMGRAAKAWVRERHAPGPFAAHVHEAVRRTVRR